MATQNVNRNEKQQATPALADRLRAHVLPISEAPSDLDPLLRVIGHCQYVLLGEASHGTHEFYALRAMLTKRLILEKGFNLVAVEADWPDAYRVNRFIRGDTRDASAQEALSGFERFPSWMWKNAVVAEFVAWLRAHCESSGKNLGFYGIDLYSLHASIRAVIDYLERADPQAGREARERYGCFDVFGTDPQRYGFSTERGFLPSCEKAVVEQLVALSEHRAQLLKQDGLASEDELFCAEQNARVVKNAEQYYRAMYRGGIVGWNLRDTHMVDTVDALYRHFAQRRDPSKIVIWAHNSHLGDARATELGQEGELNLGQLLRQRHPEQTFSIGFSTYKGQVTAASRWDGAAEKKRVRPGLPDSYDALFHETRIPRFILFPRQTPLAEELDQPRLQRAIGVVYRPQSERVSHYYRARLASQFDAFIHLDNTHAVEPLEGHDRVEPDELPETYPTGL